MVAVFLLKFHIPLGVTCETKHTSVIPVPYWTDISDKQLNKDGRYTEKYIYGAITAR